MSNQKMGPAVLGELGAGKVPATPRYAPLDRQVSYASEGASPKKVMNPFNNPVVVESDGTDLYVLSSNFSSIIDPSHVTPYTPCVTRISRSASVLDVGYYSRGARLGGISSQSLLVDMVWVPASARMFALSYEGSLPQVSRLLEVSRGPITFSPLFEAELTPTQMCAFDARLFVAYQDGTLLEFDTNGALSEPDNEASLTSGPPVSLAVDTVGQRIYFTGSDIVGYVDISSGIGSPVTTELDGADRIVWASTFAIVTTTNAHLFSVDNTLSTILSVDLSGSFDEIFGVAYNAGKAYVWGIDGSGNTAVVRVLLSDMSIEHTTTLDPPLDGEANDGATDNLMPSTRACVTDPSGNAKLWVADPLFTKALISPTGRVAYFDLTDNGNSAAVVVSLPFSRWV